MLSVCLSVIGCGETTEKGTEGSPVAAESEEAESIKETEKQTEPVYTESASYYLLEGVDRTGTEYDMDSLKPDGRDYTLSKSVDIYYVNENKCGYTKKNININVVASNDDYCYVILDHKEGFILKTKDVEAASVQGIEVAEDNSSENKTQGNLSSTGTKKQNAGTKTDDSSGRTQAGQTENDTNKEDNANNESAVDITPEETTTSDNYTPEEALAYYRSQVEAQGMKWDPSIKDVVSWGTGFLPLSKDELNADYIANAMAGYNYGSGDGTPSRTYYMEIISGEVVDFYGVPSVEVIEWGCD